MEIFVFCFEIKIGVWQNGDSRAGMQKARKTTSSDIATVKWHSSGFSVKSSLYTSARNILRLVSFYLFITVLVQKASLSHL